jgi:predicted Zn-dependent protease
LGLAASLALGVWGCATGGELPLFDEPYTPDPRDYLAFRGPETDLLEPNYLPFMVYRFREPGGEADVLAFCRWPRDAMPLPVYIAPPSIPAALQDEFSPRDPAAYVEAVEAALAIWERELEGLVGFRQVAERERAQLELTLVAREGPEPDPDRKLLGRVRLGKACRAHGWAWEGERLAVSFEVPRLHVYLADEHGLLAPEQVHRVALHEIGHALGMRSHSPVPADLMNEMVRDRADLKGLSTQDANSFISLYQLPNGAVFARMPVDAPAVRPMPDPPAGPPRLALAPHVDPRLGFSIHAPAGWTRAETAMGMMAVESVTWSYTASFQVIVQRYPTIEAYLQRYGLHYLSHGRITRDAFVVVSGRRARQVSIENPRADFAEELTFIETGDGRVFVVIADCPLGAVDAYRPWFWATLASLEIWGSPESGSREGADPLD